jgi:dipeptidyl aminopeptidase/acylaminoacyl peptidase
MDTLLAAASPLEPRIGRHRPGAWRTVARVGRTRLAATFWSRDTRRAEQLLTVGSVLAEGSLEGVGRLVRTMLRRSRGRAAALAVAATGALFGACSDGSGPEPLQLPSFVFASDAEGSLALYTFENDVVAELTPPGAEDDEPHAAGGRVVFSSMRDGNREIYFLPSLGGTARRMAANGSADVEPALRADAGMIAFVSSRSGTPRLWIVDTLGASPVALTTGSPSFVPERAPAWSPSGDRIAFTSTRTGTSQVWLVSATGGDAVQLSHESGGAFDPAWSADGSAIYYAATSGVPRIMKAVVATGETTLAAEDAQGLGQPACDAHACVAVRRPYTGDGDIVAFGPEPGSAVPVITRAGADRHPSVLSP